MKSTNICCICGKEFIGHGNNPYPVVDSLLSGCCDKCNSDIVIPARFNLYKKEEEKNESNR